MTDVSASIAKFFMNTQGMPNERRRNLVAERFPSASDGEIQRGLKIAQELLRAEAAEYFHDADLLDALKAARQRQR